MNRRSLSIITVAVIAALVGGTTTAYGVMSKSVTVTVDGQSETVRTFGSSVGELLDARDVKLRSDDRVNMQRSDRVSDGDEVVVAYARPLDVVVDGKASQQTVYTPTVGEAVEEMGVSDPKAAYVSAPQERRLPRDGAKLVVSSEKSINVWADGKKKVVRTNAPTWSDVVDEADVSLDGDDVIATRDDDDKLVPSEDDYTVPDTPVRVVRVKKVDKTETVPVDYKTSVTKDADAIKGEVDVVTEGVKGEKRQQVTLIYTDGKLHARKVRDSKLTKKPVTQVEKHGTKVESTGGGSGTGDSVWDKIAQCESGGNWQINTGNGYYGGLQFSAATWRSVGGPGLPHEHSRETQIKYAKILQARAGWGQWGCAHARFN